MEFWTLAKGSSRDFDPNGPFEDTEPDNVRFHRKRSNEVPISLKVDLKKYPCAAASPSSKGYAPREMCLNANYGYNSDLLRLDDTPTSLHGREKSDRKIRDSIITGRQYHLTREMRWFQKKFLPFFRQLLEKNVETFLVFSLCDGRV